MANGLFKEMMADVFNQRVAVGGFNIVKDLTLKVEARNKWNPPSLFKHIDQAVKEIAGKYLQPFISMGKS